MIKSYKNLETVNTHIYIYIYVHLKKQIDTYHKQKEQTKNKGHPSFEKNLTYKIK